MEQEIKRLMDLLPTLNPASDDYAKVLSSLKTLYWFNQDLKNRPRYFEPLGGMPACDTPEPTPMAEPVSAPVVEAPIEERPKEIIDPTKMTKEEVRALLSAASKAGIQIQPIIQKFVPEGKPIKFSEIPEDKYPELVGEIHNAR